MSSEILWDLPALDAADSRLVDAYRAFGLPVDQLPYTDDFEKIVEALGLPPTNKTSRRVLRRLPSLRKSGRLPSLGLHVEDSMGLH